MNWVAPVIALVVVLAAEAALWFARRRAREAEKTITNDRENDAFQAGRDETIRAGLEKLDAEADAPTPPPQNRTAGEILAELERRGHVK